MSEQLIGERYQIINTLDSGRFGQTYLAEDRHQFNLRCIVKKLQPVSSSPETWWAATQLFQQCAQTQYRLGGHPQIPQLLAYFQEKQAFYLVLEWIEGHNLSAELIPGKQFSESEVIGLLKEILKPLTFVHQQQVIHRELQPSNLIRRHRDNQLVLIDFGSVKELAATEVLNPQGETKVLATIGTPGYMPREQSRGQARLSSDIYAVGIIGIQALTGKRAQELPEDLEKAEILWGKGVQVNPKLSKVLDKMVRYDFRERYPSAVEALEALQQLTLPQSSPSSLTNRSKIPIPPSNQPPPTAVKSSGSRQGTRSAGIALAILLVGLGGWYGYRQLSLYLLLRTIQTSKQKGNYSQCISQAQAASPYSSISAQLLTLRRDCHNLQAQSYLAKARQLAAEKQYEQAKEELKRIAPDTIVYAQAQALLKRWNPANQKFYQNYQRAMDYLAQSDYQQALEKLYLAADQAIIFGQSDLLLAEMRKQEQGRWQPVAQSFKQWQLLKDILIKAEPNNYQLAYQRARLQLEGDHNHHHNREFELLFTAARQAIDNQQSDRMLSQLKQDQQERFKNLSIGHREWLNLLKALEENNKQWLEH